VPKKPTAFSSQAQLSELRGRLSADIAADRATAQELARVAPPPVTTPPKAGQPETKLPNLTGPVPPPVGEMAIPNAPPPVPR
jgi:hypothetical protein